MVLAGALTMAAGHAAMASDSLVFVGMLLIALGNGGFKPNISTQAGSNPISARWRGDPLPAHPPPGGPKP